MVLGSIYNLQIIRDFLGCGHHVILTSVKVYTDVKKTIVKDIKPDFITTHL